MNKPPLGICPAYIWHTERIKELKKAIGRYRKSGMEVPTEWIIEYSTLKLLVKKYMKNKEKQNVTD